MSMHVTLILIGVGIPGSGLLREGRHDARTGQWILPPSQHAKIHGLKATQTERRFDLVEHDRFRYDTQREITAWVQHLAGLEDQLRLMKAPPGMLTDGHMPEHLLLDLACTPAQSPVLSAGRPASAAEHFNNLRAITRTPHHRTPQPARPWPRWPPASSLRLRQPHASTASWPNAISTGRDARSSLNWNFTVHEASAPPRSQEPRKPGHLFPTTNASREAGRPDYPATSSQGLAGTTSGPGRPAPAPSAGCRYPQRKDDNARRYEEALSRLADLVAATPKQVRDIAVYASLWLDNPDHRRARRRPIHQLVHAVLQEYRGRLIAQLKA